MAQMDQNGPDRNRSREVKQGRCLRSNGVTGMFYITNNTVIE